MLDAGHGDCNVIDLCLNAPIDGTNHGRPLYAYDRYVIDTGPPGDEYLTNLERVITTYKQPKLYGGAEPDGENAIVKMFQVSGSISDIYTSDVKSSLPTRTTTTVGKVRGRYISDTKLQTLPSPADSIYTIQRRGF